MAITASDLKNMSLEELKKLHSNMELPTQEQKERAWKSMDTGIYDTQGNLVGDRCSEEDKY